MLKKLDCYIFCSVPFHGYNLTFNPFGLFDDLLKIYTIYYLFRSLFRATRVLSYTKKMFCKQLLPQWFHNLHVFSHYFALRLLWSSASPHFVPYSQHTSQKGRKPSLKPIYLYLRIVYQIWFNVHFRVRIFIKAFQILPKTFNIKLKRNNKSGQIVKQRRRVGTGN